MPETRYCAKHPNTASNLGCGRCEALVCPRCMVHTPVGLRCRECANLKPLPTYQVTTGYLTRAVVAGAVLGVVSGVAFVFLYPLLYRVPFLESIAIIAVGLLIGQGISAAVNRKRGRTLRFVAAGATLLALAIIWIIGLGVPSIFSLLAGALALYVAVNRF